MDNEFTKDDDESLTYKGKKDFSQSRSDDGLKAKRFAQELTDMSLTTFRVWFGMMSFVNRKNYLNMRIRELAKFCHVSVGSASHAMDYMERNNLIVKVSEPHRNSSWMINPELQWNWYEKDRERFKGVYHSYRKKQREYLKTKLSAIKDAKEKENLNDQDEISLEEQAVCQDKAA